MRTICTAAPCAEAEPFRYCPILGCEWREDPETQKWGAFRAGETTLQVFEDGEWHDVDLGNQAVRYLIAQRLNREAPEQDSSLLARGMWAARAGLMAALIDEILKSKYMLPAGWAERAQRLIEPREWADTKGNEG